MQTIYSCTVIMSSDKPHSICYITTRCVVQSYYDDCYLT